MNPFSRDTAEMTLREMIDELPTSDSGELRRWDTDTRSLPAIIYSCCEELQDLSRKAEVIGWIPLIEGEAVGEDFFRGVGHIMDDIQHRLSVVAAIIRKATGEMQNEREVQP